MSNGRSMGLIGQESQGMGKGIPLEGTYNSFGGAAIGVEIMALGDTILLQGF